jgi:hypothetical protein
MSCSAELFVSGPELSSCEAIARAMVDMKVIGHVTPNRTVHENGIENGCAILISEYNKEKMLLLWNRLRRQFSFECAHVRVSHQSSGCVLDFEQLSRCSSKS